MHTSRLLGLQQLRSLPLTSCLPLHCPACCYSLPLTSCLLLPCPACCYCLPEAALQEFNFLSAATACPTPACLPLPCLLL